jgi:hypothetical protein
MSANLSALWKKERRKTAQFEHAPNLFDSENDTNKTLKNKIRGLERLLKQPNLPKQAKKDKTRLLKKLQAKVCFPQLH